MNLRQLEYLVAVAEESNFTRAAARCHVVQSALSEQIAALERELRVTLFHRTSRSVRMAPAGELLLPHARALLQGAELALAEMDAFRGLVTGKLRLGVIGGAGRGMPFLDQSLLAFHQQHPEVEILVQDLGSAPMADQVRSGELDLALVGLYADQIPAGVVHHLVSDEPLVAVVSERHPLASRASITLAELARTGSLIELRSGSGARVQIDAAFERAGVERTVAFELDTPDAVARFVELGLGIALMPLGPAQALPGVAVLTLDDPAARHPVGLVHLPAEAATPCARAFLTMLLSRIAADPQRSMQYAMKGAGTAHA